MYYLFSESYKLVRRFGMSNFMFLYTFLVLVSFKNALSFPLILSKIIYLKTSILIVFFDVYENLRLNFYFL